MTPGEQTRDFYRKQGAQAEQERIIQMLKDLRGSYLPTDDLIALINGKQK